MIIHKIYFFIFFITLLLVFQSCTNKEKNQPVNDGTSDSWQTGKQPESFVFVAHYRARASLYRYYFKTNSDTLLWNKPGESVVDFSLSPDRLFAYFITVKDYGKKGVFPFIRGVNIYLLNTINDEVLKVSTLGTGLQLFGYWDTPTTYKIVMNSIDATMATYIEQRNFIYNIEGKKIFEEKKIFDLLKDGYPTLPTLSPRLNSPTVRYGVRVGSQNEISFLPERGRSISIVKKSSFKLKQVDWSSDEKKVIFSLIDISSDNQQLRDADPQTSRLYIYNHVNSKMQKSWFGSGFKNFDIVGNYLVFDTGFGNTGSIIIYNLQTGQTVSTLQPKGGCGIHNIPELPERDKN